MPFMKMLISNSLKTGTSVITYTLLHQLLKEDPIIFLPSIPLRCFKDIVKLFLSTPYSANLRLDHYGLYSHML